MVQALKGEESCMRMGVRGWGQLTKRAVEDPYNRVFCFVLFGVVMGVRYAVSEDPPEKDDVILVRI